MDICKLVAYLYSFDTFELVTTVWTTADTAVCKKKKNSSDES